MTYHVTAPDTFELFQIVENQKASAERHVLPPHLHYIRYQRQHTNANDRNGS